MFETELNTIILVIAVLTVLYWMAVMLDTLIGMRQVKVLDAGMTLPDDTLPEVSIIITAKDEEASIARSLRSLQNLDYPKYEVIVVNDRSEDGTLDEIMKIQKEWPRLQVVTIEELPDGWVGKNYACYRGYEKSTGGVLLFTDADVMFKPESLKTAIAHLETHSADHLAVSPAIYGESFFLRLFVKYFFFSFLIFFRPWAGGMGVGAFNMFRREAYEHIGTHRSVALRPDEDLQLGKLVKKSGLRQRFASGKLLLSVQWYTSLREAMYGIEKNAFAGLSYNYFMAGGAVLGQVVLFVIPFVAVFLTGDVIQHLYVAVIVMIFTVFIIHTTVFSMRKGYDAVFLPIAALLFLFTICRALIKTILYRGIHWRGTFYSLQELRKR